MNKLPRPSNLRKGQLWKSRTNFVLVVDFDDAQHILWIDTDSFHMKVSQESKSLDSLRSYTYIGTLNTDFTRDLLNRMATV